MQKTDLPYYVTNFFTIYLPGQKNLSKNTIASYAATFKLFFIFCKDKKNIPPEKLKLPNCSGKRPHMLGCIRYDPEDPLQENDIYRCSVSVRGRYENPFSPAGWEKLVWIQG